MLRTTIEFELQFICTSCGYLYSIFTIAGASGRRSFKMTAFTAFNLLNRWSNNACKFFDSKEVIARLAQQVSTPAQTLNLVDLQLR